MAAPKGVVLNVEDTDLRSGSPDGLPSGAQTPALTEAQPPLVRPACGTSFCQRSRPPHELASAASKPLGS